MNEEIHKGDWIVYAGHVYEVADASGWHIGIYDEPPSKHVDYLNRSSIRLATAEDINNDEGEDKYAFLTT